MGQGLRRDFCTFIKNMNMTIQEFRDGYEWGVLKPQECVKTFSCGDEDLDNFIINEFSDYSKALLAVTYVVREKTPDRKIVAYFSLAADKLSVTDFNSNSEFNRFRKQRFVLEKRIRSYPAVKLCRLGVDRTVRKRGLGSVILASISYFLTHGNRIGCRFLTVDAYKIAVPFYEKNGFQALTNKDIERDTRMLYLDLHKITGFV